MSKRTPLTPLLPAARMLAIAGQISPAGFGAYHTASVAADALPPAARSASIRATLARLVEEDPAAALHGLAAAIRAETEATAEAVML